MFEPEALEVDLEKMATVKGEDFKEEWNVNFLHDVYDLVMVLEEKEKEMNRVRDHLNERIREDHIESSKWKKTIICSDHDKSFMCPLMDNCPDKLPPRWPFSNISTHTQLGAKCPFAHHTYELKFGREIRSKKKMLMDSVRRVDKMIEGVETFGEWVPGGAPIEYCIGCGPKLEKAGVSKGLCGYCELKRAAKKKIDAFRIVSEIKKKILMNKPSVIKSQKRRKAIDKNFNTKMSILHRAKVLFSKERLTDALDVIMGAITIVQKEYEGKEKEDFDYEKKVKKRLGIDASSRFILKLGKTIEINSLLKLYYSNPKDLEQQESKSYKQKVWFLAVKLGVVGEKEPDVNSFINNEIEELYLKIRKSLNREVRGIDIMKAKVEKLETLEMKGEPLGKTEICIEFKEKGRCEAGKKCDKIHYKSTQYELRKPDDVIENLQKAIKTTEKKLTKSVAIKPWLPSNSKEMQFELNEEDPLENNPKEFLRVKRLRRKLSGSDFENSTIYSKTQDELKSININKSLY